MTPEEKLAADLRAHLASAGRISEVRMFGGIGFMLNGNMLVAASKRGLLARVGKDAQAAALARPGARKMEMGGRVMQGYVFVDPSALSKASVASWLALARIFVESLPSKKKTAIRKGRKK